jgi:hypothetical protein
MWTYEDMWTCEKEIERLLLDAFDQIESLWDRDPYNGALAYALTVKEFMTDRHIQSVEEGLRSFAALKQIQTRMLAELGIGLRSPSARAVFARPLATQTA